MKNKFLFLMVMLSILLFIGVSSNANADIISINPNTQWGEWLNTNVVNDYINELTALNSGTPLTMLYKAEVDEDNELVVEEGEGLYISSYETSFNSFDGPSEAIITWEGGDFISSITFQ